MDPQQIRDYIRAAVEAGQSMFTIVQTLSREASINAQSAAQHVNDEMQNMGTPLSVEAARGLFKQALDLDTKTSYQQYGRFPQIRDSTAVATPTGPVAGGYVDSRTAQQIAREEASLTYGGRQNIFGGFMGAQPGFGQYNPLVQRGVNRAFAPLSAQFGLQAALDPYWADTQGGGAPETLDFRSFLQGTPQRWGQQDWINQLAPLGAAFSAGLGGTPGQLDLQAAYGDEAIQDRLMSAVLGQGVSPYLRRFVPGSVGQIRQRMFETDPSVAPFQQFLNNPLTWGAGR